MSLIPIVHLCAFMTGAEIPPPPDQCLFADDFAGNYETEEECEARATEILNDPDVRLYVYQTIMGGYGPGMQTYYAIYCIPVDEVREFYQEQGIPELDDIPQDT